VFIVEFEDAVEDVAFDGKITGMTGIEGIWHCLFR
jgi:hypothetical protein